MDELDYFRATFGLREQDVLLVPFGSRLYGTHGPQSDRDYIAIVPAHYRSLSGQEYRHNDVNIQVYNSHEFQRQLDQHQVHAVEGYFVPGAGVAERFRFQVDRQQLRREWMRKSSFSFVRAKKKMRIEGDLYAGKKSLFHALRILVFGIELARSGRLVDFAAANAYWGEIRARPEADWEAYRASYQPVHNRLSSEFRQATRPA